MPKVTIIKAKLFSQFLARLFINKPTIYQDNKSPKQQFTKIQKNFESSPKPKKTSKIKRLVAQKHAHEERVLSVKSA
ncbi:hypothetical protein B0181_09460 [Moraxella caviae]|uniref:Uncharacterized protein n=1 Tax=Moraxella caviae TaxID=34060 RepID=A0A1S9ZWP0_9GAMM|nr:hypothetical protein B0181_09460 [Moraxella caviae]